MKKATALISAAIAVSLSPVFSMAGENTSDKTDSDYFTVKSEAVTFTVTDMGKEATPETLAILPYLRDDINKEPITGAVIINGGLQAWGVINSAQPDGNANTGYANAMPNWVDWYTIAGWKGPKEVVYSYTVTNLMNIDVIKVKYKISFYYGGASSDNGSIADCLIAAGCLGGADTCPDIAAKCAAAVNGKGRYISNLKVTPLAVNILWGFKFDLDCLVSNPMNIGTLEDPLAYLQTDLMWSRSTPFKKTRGVWTYAMDGNGNFKDLTIKEKALTKGIPAPVEFSEIPSVSWD